MERKIPKNTMSSIRAKLVSAVAMLLVAVTMVVSSTYAWFTLSTAPEVSGITTAVGANGALEIWLNASTDGNTLSDPLNNHTPGNIVNLADTDGHSYGLDQVILLPSQLYSSTSNGKTYIESQFVKYPSYGANGKPGELINNASPGVFSNGDFFANDVATGVRAVGETSGMTPRQLAYRNAKYSATSNANKATNKATESLNTNGGVLGSIVIKKTTNATPVFTVEEKNTIGIIVTDLETIAGFIRTAYEDMIVALAASAQVTGVGSDTVYSTIKANFANDSLNLEDIAATDKIEDGDYSVSLTGTALLTGIEDFLLMLEDIEAARTTYDAIPTKTEYAWADISTVFGYLVDMENATLNGESVSGADMNTLANSVMNGGINIGLNPGAGVYVDIADHCGDYSASVTMTDVTAGSFHFDTITANMATNSDLDTSYLRNGLSQVEAAQAPTGTSDEAMPMTEFYGFIIDLAFRTNAANSNLLLQTEAVDRIYADNNNEATQGKGSYMTYKATTVGFTNEQVKNLMDCIRIVFFDPETLEIIGEARLDTVNATIGADGVTAKMYMYIDNTNDGADNGVLQNGTGDEATNKDSTIEALTQNGTHNISVFVYLDGEDLGNDDVAATDVTSVTGTMNLQFASSAELKPMEYGDLHTPNEE